MKFEQRFQEMLNERELTAYKVALSVGLSPSYVKRVLIHNNSVSFENRLKVVEAISKSPLIDIDFGTMAAWLAIDYLPPESIQIALKVLEALEASESYIAVDSHSFEKRHAEKHPNELDSL